MHHPTIGSTELESVFTHCQNWRSACAKMTVVDYLLSPVYQKAPRGRRGAFFCWNAYRREFPRVRDIGQSAAWQWGVSNGLLLRNSLFFQMNREYSLFCERSVDYFRI